jgi:hypothetical protein
MAMPPIDIPNMTETTKVLTMMRDALIGHDTRLQNLRDDQSELKADVELLKSNVLTGAGTSLSHAERIRNLETFAESVKDTIKYWGRLIGGALILNFLGFATGILVAILKFLPILERLASQP